MAIDIELDVWIPQSVSCYAMDIKGPTALGAHQEMMSNRKKANLDTITYAAEVEHCPCTVSLQLKGLVAHAPRAGCLARSRSEKQTNLLGNERLSYDTLLSHGILQASSRSQKISHYLIEVHFEMIVRRWRKRGTGRFDPST